ncbi:MAG: hypothetical protein VKS61_15525 [Candidatus Sericytochromatia bacterium]|nr:hypothetical protein [Candidatus Sericytochromatia bacterium]
MTITRRLGVTILGLATLTGCQAQPPIVAAEGTVVAEQPAGERHLLQTSAHFTRQPPASDVGFDHQHRQATTHHRGHSRQQHRLFGRVGEVFTGSVYPYLSTRFATPALFYTDVLSAQLHGLPGLGALTAARLARGGRFLVFIQNGEMGLYDMRTHLIRTFPTLRGLTADPWSLDVDALGNISYVDTVGRIHVYDTDSGQDYIVPAAGRLFNRRNPLSLSGNGRFLVVGGSRDLLLTDLTTNRQLVLPFAGRPLHRGDAFVLSHDGRCLLFQAGNQLRLMDIQTGGIDELAGLNIGDGLAPRTLGFGGQIRDAQFLDGRCQKIAFERAGVVQVFDRTTGLLTPMSISQGIRDLTAASRLRGVTWGRLGS